MDASTVRVPARAQGTISTEDDFMAMVEPHLERLARLASRLVGPADRDDVVQETVLRAWLKKAQFDPRRGAFSSWLFAIAADRARKTRRRHNSYALPARTTSDPGIDNLVDIERALKQLSARQRLAVDCFYFGGLSVAETSAVMRCPEGTVKSTLAAARDNLRPLLRVR